MSVRLAPNAWTLALASLVMCGFAACLCSADEPTLPAEKPSILSNGLSTDAYYFLDGAGNRVIMPGMTLEELERLKNLDEGYAQPVRPYSFQSLAVTGTVTEHRAELTVKVKIHVDVEQHRSIGIPLRMGNFHLSAPADVSGVEDSQTDYDPEERGHILWLSTDKPRDVEVSMRVAARVQSDGRTSLEFQLPAAPSTVSLDVSGTDLVATTEGRGDEVVRAIQQDAQTSQLMVESSGGTFRLNWGQASQSDGVGQVLEAKSVWALRWLSIEDKPTASVDLTVTNLRGDLAPFEFELPADVRLLEQLGSEIVPLGEASTLTNGQRFRVIPDTSTPSDEIKLQLEIEFTADTIDAQSPLSLQGLHVVGAIIQSGEVEVRSDEDYRLRWLRRPWVRNLPGAGRPAGDPDTYRFSFDRVPFELPLWLAARQRRLQVDPQFDVRIRQTLAELTTVIRISGAATDGRSMPIEMRGWTVQSIETDPGGDPLESSAEGTLEEIDLSSLSAASNANEEAALVVRAVRTIPADENRIELPLPHIVSEDGGMLIQPGELTVHTEPGLALVVDLADSMNIDEQPSFQLATGSNPAFRFDVQTLAPDAKLVGFLENERPRVTLQSSASVSLEEGHLVTLVEWDLRPQRGLAGQIPLSMPSSEDWQDWSVTVDDRPAVLQETDDGQVMLVSDLLGNDQHRVRFRQVRMLDPQAVLPTDIEVRLPRPGISDLSTLGEVPISLRGSPAIDIDTEIAGRSVSDLTLDALPSRPLLIRLRPRALQQQRLVMSRVVLTTQCGRGSRSERLLATVSGSGNLRIGLPRELNNLAVVLKVDDELQARIANTDGALNIPLSADRAQHIVDLQIWFTHESSSLGSRLRPTIGLPVGVGQVYWNVILPADQHIVWASPTLGRSMSWEFDRWRMRRVPSQSEATLSSWAGGTMQEQVAIGNRYLFIGSDATSFRTVSFGRAVIWGIVGGVVLLISTLLVSVRQIRHPLSVVVAAVALCGLTLLAPDAAVLVGQLTLLAMSLVAVMLGVRAALRARPHERILDSSKRSPRDGSTRSLTAAAASLPPTGSTQTRSLQVAINSGDES
ncbi:hypothetical protein [Roseimaritima ulvae]|uniref:Uncharacterized protein n=1 Tax=Roseimaritima ulvae TaxID=980254 RepID=A0A5B9QT21_9BACT|nr:hypothetical protein [Roseimaritima ulvae]QEG40226.1 hypothetical protein UC8_22330 [Roseimaritima ulvae]